MKLKLFAALHPCSLCTAPGRLFGGLLLGALSVAAQTQSVPPGTPDNSTPFVEVERGPHHKRWVQVNWEDGPGGQRIAHTNAYTELATGMHFLNADGQWSDATEEIESVPDGAVARHGQHRVIFANNLATPGAIDMEMPDGQRLRSHILGLSYLDTATGTNILLAEVKDCAGKVMGNQVLYDDALTGLKATVIYTYTKAGFEQDVLLRSQPPTPESFGLSPETTVLQVLTEFIDPPQPAKSPRTLTAPSGTREPDEDLSFGAMKIGRGRAFLMGAPVWRSGGIPVSKQWQKMDGRDILIEQVPIPDIEDLLRNLPKSQGASLSPGSSNAVTRLASAKRILPQPRRVKESKSPMEMASAPPPSTGLLLDYQTLNISQTNYIFQHDLTYYISGLVNISGTATIEGGTVIKLPVSTTASIAASNVVCTGQAYKPVIFTAKDDDQIADVISGSSGNPSGYYGKIALDLSAGNNPALTGLRFCYLSNALAGTGITLRDCQFIRCNNAFAPAVSQPNLYNVLFYRLNSVVPSAGGGGDTVTAENVTGHFVTNFLGNLTGTISLTNCLFVGVTNWQCSTTHSNCNVILDSDAGVFQTVGGGDHYLADGSTNRNAGSTNIDANLLADLRARTTYPPLVFSNSTISVDTNFLPQAQRDTDQPDLGYEYDALDYAFGGATANANLTFPSGTAVGWFRTSSGWYHAGHGIHIGDGKTVNFNGHADAPDYWVRCNVVQEGCNGLWQGGYGPGGLSGWGPDTNSARINAQFTRFNMLVNENSPLRDDWGWLIGNISHCEFYGGTISPYNAQMYYTNCLFDRVATWTEASWPDAAFYMINCTMRGGVVHPHRSDAGTNSPVMIRDSAFDNTTVTTDDVLNPSVVYFNYNAFVQGSSRTIPNGANDVIVTNFNWQTSWLGTYYLPTNSPLIDTGSLTNAGLVGLYHFTTQTNQVKEATNHLDVAYHYVAVDGSGRPIDTDGDGIPDYLEDASGNGTVDGSETSWLIYNSPNGLAGANKFQIFTPLK
jgi:hypothetical protein